MQSIFHLSFKTVYLTIRVVSTIAGSKRTVCPDGKFVFNIWSFGIIKICPIAHLKFAKTGSKFTRIPNNPSKYCQGFLTFAKVVKFRQIWSHCKRT